MGMYQDKKDLLKQIADQTLSGAGDTQKVQEELERLAAEVNSQLSGSATGERAAAILDNAASGLQTAVSALLEAKSKMDSYYSRLEQL